MLLCIAQQCFQFPVISSGPLREERNYTGQGSQTTLERIVQMLMSRAVHKMIIRVSTQRRIQKRTGYNEDVSNPSNSDQRLGMG